MKRAVISGYYGFDNTGDEAILGSMLEAFRHQAALQGGEITFTVLSARPQETAARHGVESVSRTNLWQILRAISRADVFISGGGGLLQDTTGLRLSVAYYLGLTALARLLGKPVIFYAHGIGPILYRLNRLLVRLVANRVERISVRDEGSRQELARLGVNRPPISVTADPAFLLNLPEGSGEADHLLADLPPGPLIGVAVRSWHDRERYLGEIAAAADCLARDLGGSIVIIPMYHSYDLSVSRELASLLKSPHVLLEQNLAPHPLLQYFSRLHLVLAVRLHALIFAAVAGVPMVGVGYDPKVEAFLARLGLSTAGDTGEVDASLLVRQATERWEEREEVRELLAQKRAEFHAAAEQTAKETVEFILAPKRR